MTDGKQGLFICTLNPFRVKCINLENEKKAKHRHCVMQNHFSFGNFKINTILLQINFFPRFAIHVMSNYRHPAHINVKKMKIIKDFSF